MTASAEILFALLRAALGKGAASCEGAEARSERLDLGSVSGEVWKEVVDLSFDQGVAAIAVDGLGFAHDNVNPNPNHNHNRVGELLLDSPELEDVKYEWFGEVFSCEKDAAARAGVTERLVRLWAAEGIRTIVLKGAAFAQYYPNPSHRYSCDLDLFIGDDWEKGCRVLERQGVNICYEVYKDAEFHIDNVYVECHRFLMSIRGNGTLRRMEHYLRRLLAEGCTTAYDDAVVMPSLMFNALFCIEHARGHLLHGPLTLRQVCDWMLLRRQPVDWEEFWLRCDEFALTRFAHLMDALADLVEGKVTYGELASVDRKVVDEMLMAGGSSQEADGSRKTSSFFQRRVRQFFTILGNGWKYREFNDVSMPVALFRQVWTHFFRKKVEL